MPQNDFPYDFERAFVDVVARRAEARGYKKGEFAAKRWPWMKPKVAATRWNAIRCKAIHTGKPQNVTIADALRMAAALGEDIAYLMVIANESLKREYLDFKREGKDAGQ